jgi:predicted HTH domain antitoxin
MMHAVNIRQLKNNPSTALRAARDDDMVVVMNRDHPEALLVSLDRLQLPEPAAVRVALAVSLFRSGAVSAGFAARMADKPLAQMLTLLSSLGIPLSGNTEAEGREDMASVRQWRNEGS